MSKLSVVICTHNPHEDFLSRTLDGMRAQTLAQNQWELIMVDNGSEIPIAQKFDLSWHPHSRHIREDELGLTAARLTGISESTGEIVVFVDDDNILAVDYLTNALDIAKNYLFLGAWGGSCVAEYEITPPIWFLDYEGNIAVRKVEEIIWSNQYFDYKATPVGAGMCVRKSVADKYSERLKTDAQSQSLDRKGDSLMSCGDHDIAWTSITMGLGMGVFPSLELIHIIPEFRLQKDYILRLLEGDACSSTIMRAKLLGEMPRCKPMSWRSKIKHLVRIVEKLILGRENSFHDQVASAKIRGSLRAIQILDSRFE